MRERQEKESLLQERAERQGERSLLEKEVLTRES